MTQATRASEIGLRQARLICKMPSKQRIEFIAKGLPVIFDSAQSLVRASQALENFSREAEILEGHAEEECAKILILIDVVRCPPQRVASCIGPMMKSFYSHLARLIYAQAQSWKPVTAKDLQHYVDNERKSHYLEGGYGEYIMPNWTLFRRETSLYADVAGDEDGEPSWISPIRQAIGLPALIPASFRVVDALSAFGVCTIEGLKILANVWSKVEIKEDTNWSISQQLYRELAENLESAGLITDRATQDHAFILFNSWQLPMYNIDLTQINVPLEDLLEERESNVPYDY